MKSRNVLRALIGALCIPATALAQTKVAAGAAPTAIRPNELTDAEREAGWRLLFDGKSLRGWLLVGTDSIVNWRVEDGAIKRVPIGPGALVPDGHAATRGDLVSEASFTDFELSWEWKVVQGGNSGVKYNVATDFAGASSANAAFGFEYQILDDSLAEDNATASHRAGALYDIIAPNELKKLNPAGVWNHSMIVMKGNRGEHWLNGALIVEFELGTPRVDSLIARSKYALVPDFAKRRAGRIILQDHGGEVHFRSIKVREIKHEH